MNETISNVDIYDDEGLMKSAAQIEAEKTGAVDTSRLDKSRAERTANLGLIAEQGVVIDVRGDQHPFKNQGEKEQVVEDLRAGRE